MRFRGGKNTWEKKSPDRFRKPGWSLGDAEINIRVSKRSSVQDSNLDAAPICPLLIKRIFGSSAILTTMTHP
jgi:hypothetical protein